MFILLIISDQYSRCTVFTNVVFYLVTFSSSVKSILKIYFSIFKVWNRIVEIPDVFIELLCIIHELRTL